MSRPERTTVLISGGGPAGIVLGLLLARAGISVTVLEKHTDFLRDFRGDTVHASTMKLMDDLGLGSRFRQLPQGRLGNLELPGPDGSAVIVADFSRLPEPNNCVRMIPQWDLLAFLAAEADREPGFRLRMGAESVDLLRSGNRVTGVRWRTRGEETLQEIHADLTVVCEGRNSVLRRQLDLPSTEFPVPFDVWWFQLPKRPGDEQEAPRIAPRLGEAEGLLRLARPEHDQLAYLAPKGSDQQLRAEGVAALRQRIASLAPELTDRLKALTSMDDVHRLDVRLDRLRRWYAEGVLCIGDAAHAMTPVGGVGINLAIQDAVAAARILGPVLQRGRVAPSDLARVQRRRMPPTRVVQWMQRAVNARVLRPVFERRRSGPPPALPALMKALPVLSALPARLISYGPRAEPTPEFARRAPAAHQDQTEG